MIKLLAVDDSALMRKLLVGIFEAEGDFEVRTAPDGVAALAALHDFAPDVITLDVHMPDMDGLTCLSRIMVEMPRPVVMVSSLTTESAAATVEAMHLGAVDVVAKPRGAVSLGIDDIRDDLVAKVRAAAAARLPPTLRLRERVRHRLRRGTAERPPRQARSGAAKPAAAAPAGEAPGLVLIGASTGGPQALEIVLAGLPAELPWPVLVAQHMPAHFTNAFARRLDGCCALEVVEVDRPAVLAPGHVYVARGDADMVVSRRPHGIIAMPAPASPRYRWHPSVDRLVASAGDHLAAERLIGVLMTGMGSDGAETMTALLAAGGRTIAEAESTAIVWGMPGELVRMGGAAAVLPVDGIAAEIERMVTRTSCR